MKPFNLAEERIRQRAVCRREIRKRARVLAALLLLDLLAFAGFLWCRSSVAGEMAVVEAELAGAQERCVSLKQSLLALKTKSGQRKWHEQLAQSSNRWLSLLDKILCSVPEGVWLHRVETSESANAVTVEGQALSMNLVSDFMRALKECGDFSNVQLNSAQVTGLATSPLEIGRGGNDALVRKSASGYHNTVAFALQAKLQQKEGTQVQQAAQAVPNVQGSP
ncbi:MAG: PilN domain-containing protein [Armatimonadota bacterium]|nr:PilN domain-containing protein [Armatimonadota bacterium]